MKKYFKIVILVVLISIGIMQYDNVYASIGEETSFSIKESFNISKSIDSIIKNADKALKDAEAETVTDNDEEQKKDITIDANPIRVKESSDVIFGMLFTIGVAVTVIVGGILGIKFMIASVEDKAKIKEMLIPYIVGCVVIYGAFAIWKITVDILSAV